MKGEGSASQAVVAAAVVGTAVAAEDGTGARGGGGC